MNKKRKKEKTKRKKIYNPNKIPHYEQKYNNKNK